MAEDLKNQSSSKSLRAEDLMSTIVVTVKENTLVRDAAHLMLRDRVSGIPVVNDQNNIVGIVTVTDLFRVVDNAFRYQNSSVFYRKLLHGEHFKVKDVMSPNVLSVSPTTSLEEIVNLSLDLRIHSFPVVTDGKLVGIIGRHDILNAVFNLY